MFRDLLENILDATERISFKSVVVLACGVVSLVSGIIIGTNYVKDDELATEASNLVLEVSTAGEYGPEIDEDELAKEVFSLNEDCEIWIQDVVISEGNIENRGMMVGVVPEELLNMSYAEIVGYFEEKYPSKIIETMNTYEIVLVEKDDLTSEIDSSKAGKYSIEEDNGYICVYIYDDLGVPSLVEQTTILTSLLPDSAREELQLGIFADTEDEIYSILETYDS